jgi:hypothetical protein
VTLGELSPLTFVADYLEDEKAASSLSRLPPQDEALLLMM